MRKTLPFSLPWPPASTRPRDSSSLLRADHSTPSGTWAEVTRVRGIGRVGEELEAHGSQAGAGGGATGGVAREDALVALRLDQRQRGLELEEEADRRRPGRLALGQDVTVPDEVEVEARHGGALGGGPGALGRRHHGQARRDHPGLLRAGDHDVEVPGVHLEGHGTDAADAVDDDERVRGLRADGGGQLPRAGW